MQQGCGYISVSRCRLDVDFNARLCNSGVQLLFELIRGLTMNQTVDFEIPANVREAIAKSVEQAKDAYVRLTDASRQAQELVAKSTSAMTSGAKELQEKAIQYTEANVSASFEAATRLVNAKDIKEALEIQGQFARRQVETYTQQAQEMSRLVAQAAQKAQPVV